MEIIQPLRTANNLNRVITSIDASSASGGIRSNRFRTAANVLTNFRLQTFETTVGTVRANQFGSCPKVPTYTKSMPSILAHTLRPRRGAMILRSNAEAGTAILRGSVFVLRKRSDRYTMATQSN